MQKKFLLSLFLLVWGLCAFSQDYRLMLQSGSKPDAIGLEQYASRKVSLLGSRMGNGNYVILQFHQIPTHSQKEEIRRAGIQLFDYLPHFAFWAYLPDEVSSSNLQNLGVKSIYPYAPTDKIAKLITDKGIPDWAIKERGNVDLLVQIYPNIPLQEALGRLVSLGWVKVVQEKFLADVSILRVPIQKMQDLAQIPFVYFIEPIFPPAQLENREATSNHRINFVNSEYAGGRKYDGTGIVVSMGDDGTADTHIDKKGRITNNITSNSGNHGDHVSGIIMGAGNLNPLMKGQAPGAHLEVYSYHDDIDQMPTPYNTKNVRITSHSLGESLNAGYNTGARQVDQQIRQMPDLMHVFSAGNSGSAFYTITGGRKAGKNVIAVANLSKTDAISSSSSRGPAADGRLKPEVSAVGSSVNSTGENNTYYSSSGTSMACPAVSGTLAALYHAYRALNSNAMPTSDIIKGIVMNTADDLGNAGPDFTFGYGRINARRAVLTLEQNRYYVNSITQGVTQTQTINVPAGTKQLKVMLYWNDYEGAAGASVPLVNNLNLTVTPPSASPVNPWILNPSATSDPAVRGVDNINNSEQVTIDDPAAGTYTISVNGFAVPQGPQQYVVCYEFVQDDVVLTFPIGGESFTPGTTEKIRWDAWGSSGSFDLEYSANGGTTWTSIITGLAGSTRSYDWNVPNVQSGQVRVRVSKGALQSQSIANFSIMPFPSGLSASAGCSGVNLSWSTVTGATSYEVFRLGTKYMESVGTTTATNFADNVPTGDTYWYAVRALGPSGAVSRRCNAISFNLTSYVCATDAAIANISPSGNSCNMSENSEVKITVQNVGTSTLNNLTLNYEVKKSDNTLVTSGSSNIVSLAANATQEITFTANLGIIDETYQISATVNVTGDQNASNNQRNVSAKNVSINLTLAYDNGVLRATQGHRNYRWFRDGQFLATTGANHEWSPNTLGTYQVEAQSYTNNCKKMSNEVVVTVLSLQDVSNELLIVPNPTESEISITLPKNLQNNSQFTLIDVKGRKLLEGSLQENQNIDVSKLPKGLYILEIKNATHRAIRKVAKQ
ncbi:S8 family serine peptidase [Raineya orbicola]|uniref:Por secretion system C-terminal sorting domain n=1 Tax=Raineya orbicola TaxID=2016530 RepID=A0A2N3ICQ8_9BACT|nr:S8 family serine peptidase [Raineya orbicola]PKQ68065.1 Por secretion system C-terminal sorting domain [Raineya orbicola]